MRRRLPDRRVAVVSVLPVKDLDTLAPAGDDLKRADYLLYTIAAEARSSLAYFNRSGMSAIT